MLDDASHASIGRDFYAVDSESDVASFERGRLVPPSSSRRAAPPSKLAKAWRATRRQSATLGMALLLVVGAGLSLGSMQVLLQQTVPSEAAVSSATPVVIENPQTGEQTPLTYGVELPLADPDFYNETRESFIANERTFLSVNLAAMQLQYYENGEVVNEMPILSKGAKGSWRETPPGLYRITSKNEDYYSPANDVYQPWSMAFQGNFFIHGWPYNAEGTQVPDEYSGGSVRLATNDAERLYQQVSVDTPVLVFEERTDADRFVYEPRVPDVNAPHYLLADLESNTVLASSDLNDPQPIASLTKLMTALVAAEYLDLDSSVRIDQPSFVQSLVPRLGNRTEVSMYSLLQLLLVESSNEAAQVIADQLGREQFVTYMNQKAQSLGLSNTTFADPSGLSANNVSSLRDLFRLTRYIENNRNFILDLTADQDIPTAYPSGQFGELNNFNEVTDLENFIAGKVGETRAAGQTSITLHRLQVQGETRTVAIVLLDSNQRSQDVQQLLQYARDQFGDTQ